MTGKPVYLAGRGFQEDDERPSGWRRWWGLILLLLLLVSLGLWSWRRERGAGTCRLTVTSSPAGAQLVLNLKDGYGQTPATVEWPRDQPVLVQVKLPGLSSQPLAIRLEPTDLALAQRELDFTLLPTPAAGRLEAAATDSIATPEQQPGAEQVAPALTEKLLQANAARLATPPKAVDPGGHTVGWIHWDPAFRLRINGRVQPGPTQVLEPGSQRVQVDLRGRLLLDTLLARSGAHRLILPGPESFVEVRISPPEAEIVQGDATLGKGRVLVHRRELPQEVSFPALPGWLAPPSVTLTAQSAMRVEYAHRRAQQLQWTPQESGGIYLLDMGYELEGRYREDAAHAPRREGKDLLLGRAFHDRRPGGAQALRLGFDLPESANAQWAARLEIHATDSGHKHPLTLTRGATLSVWLNGTLLAKEMKLDLDEAPRSWPVSNMLRPGRNELRIQSSEQSRSSTRLRSVQLKVGP